MKKIICTISLDDDTPSVTKVRNNGYCLPRDSYPGPDGEKYCDSYSEFVSRITKISCNECRFCEKYNKENLNKFDIKEN